MGDVATGGYRRGGNERDLGVVGSIDDLRYLSGFTGATVRCLDQSFGIGGREYVWDGGSFVPADIWHTIITQADSTGFSLPKTSVAVTVAQTVTGGAATQITNGVTLSHSDPNISYSSDMRQSGTGFPDNGSIRGYSVYNGSANIPGNVTAQFGIDCTEFEIRFKALASTFQVRLAYKELDSDWINGGDFTATAMTAGSSYRIKWTFASKKMRHVRIEMGNPYIYEWVISQGGTIFPIRSNAFRTMAVGDSFTEGASAIAGVFGVQDTWSVKMARAMGWSDHWVSAVGGTGFIETAGKINAVDRIPTDIIPYKPDLIITALGTNDSSTGLEAQMHTYINTIKASHPTAVLGFISAWNPRSTGDSSKWTILQSVLAATPYKSCFGINGSVFTGTGRVSATVGDGNSDFYIGADGTHPTKEGHEYLAFRMGHAILRVARSRCF